MAGLFQKIIDKRKNKDAHLRDAMANYADTRGFAMSSQCGSEEGNKVRYLIAFARAVIITMIITGTIGILVTALSLPVSMPVVIASTASAALVMGLLYPKKWLHDLVLVAVFVFMIYFVIRYYRVINSGFCGIMNVLIERVDEQMNIENYRSFTEVVANRQFSMTMCCGFIGFAIALYTNSVFNASDRLHVCSWLTYIIMAVVFYLELVPSMVWFGLMILGYATSAVGIVNGHAMIPFKNRNTIFWRDNEYSADKKIKKKKLVLPRKLLKKMNRKKKADEKTHTFHYLQNSLSTAKTGLGLILPVFLGVAIISVSNSSGQIVHREAKRTQARKMVDDTIRDLVVNGLGGLFNDIKSTGGLSSGRLGQIRSVNLDFQTDLQVTFVPHSTERIFLKEHTYSRYEGTYWYNGLDGNWVYDKIANELANKAGSDLGCTPLSLRNAEALEIRDKLLGDPDYIPGLYSGKMNVKVVDPGAGSSFLPNFSLLREDTQLINKSQDTYLGLSGMEAPILLGDTELTSKSFSSHGNDVLYYGIPSKLDVSKYDWSEYYPEIFSYQYEDIRLKESGLPEHDWKQDGNFYYAPAKFTDEEMLMPEEKFYFRQADMNDEDTPFELQTWVLVDGDTTWYLTYNELMQRLAEKYMEDTPGYADDIYSYRDLFMDYRYSEDFNQYLCYPSDLVPTLEHFKQRYGLNGSREDVINAILKAFREDFSYTYSPGKTPKEKDFVTYFLEETKAGYCSYFATAATLLLRYNGIPARYCEGYAIDYEQVLEGELAEGEKYEDWFYGTNELGQTAVVTVDVTDADAHAWVEVYYEGFGWIPVEFTVATVQDGEYESFWSQFASTLGGITDYNTDFGDNADDGIYDSKEAALRFRGFFLMVVRAVVIALAAAVLFMKLLEFLRLHVLGSRKKKMIYQYHMLNLLIRNADREAGMPVAYNNFHFKTEEFLVNVLKMDEQKVHTWIASLEKISYSPAEPTEQDYALANEMFRQGRKRFYRNFGKTRKFGFVRGLLYRFWEGIRLR